MRPPDNERRPPEAGPEGGLAEDRGGRLIDNHGSTVVVAHGEDAVAVLARRWLDLAGQRLARQVATGKVCNRCARSAITTIGLAGGIGPGLLAREGLKGYDEKLRSIAAAVLVMLDEVDAA